MQSDQIEIPICLDCILTYNNCRNRIDTSSHLMIKYSTVTKIDKNEEYTVKFHRRVCTGLQARTTGEREDIYAAQNRHS